MNSFIWGVAQPCICLEGPPGSGPLAASGGQAFSAVLTAYEPHGGECGHEDCSDWCGHPRPGSAPQEGGRTCPGWGRGSPPRGRRCQEGESPRVGTSFHLEAWPLHPTEEKRDPGRDSYSPKIFHPPQAFSGTSVIHTGVSSLRLRVR